MWLPQNERRLLQGYYLKINEVDREKWFHISDWGPVVNSRFVRRNARRVKAYGEGAQTNEIDNDTLQKKKKKSFKFSKI